VSDAVDILRQAARLCREDPRREGNVVLLDAGTRVIATGDIHGHHANLRQIVAAADLAARPRRRLVLQEIIHGPPDAATGRDRSIECLLDAARCLIEHPEQVVMLLGNHDVAQLTGNEITKEGRGACKAFAEGVRHAFGAEAPDVLDAVSMLALAMPLAVRCGGGVMVSHSLPAPGRWSDACEQVLHRRYTPDDMRRRGGVYEWTWGRGHTPESVAPISEKLGVSFFLIGHYHLEVSHRVLAPTLMTITSDGPDGRVLPFDAGETLRAPAAERSLLAARTLRSEDINSE